MVAELGPMRRTSETQIFLLLEKSGWVLTAEIKKFMKTRLSQIGQSKVIEDGFAVGRRMERSSGNTEVLGVGADWVTLGRGMKCQELLHRHWRQSSSIPSVDLCI